MASSEFAAPPNETVTSPPSCRIRATLRSRSSDRPAPSNEYAPPQLGSHGASVALTTNPSTADVAPDRVESSKAYCGVAVTSTYGANQVSGRPHRPPTPRA